MRKNPTTRMAYQAASCGLCQRPIDFPSGFFFDTEEALGIVHPDCMAYELECGPVRAGARVAHTCGNAVCLNPAHLAIDLAEVAWDPCDGSEPIDGQAHIGCYTATPQDWVFDHFHGLIDGAPCAHRHQTWADADQCAGK